MTVADGPSTGHKTTSASSLSVLSPSAQSESPHATTSKDGYDRRAVACR